MRADGHICIHAAYIENFTGHCFCALKCPTTNIVRRLKSRRDTHQLRSKGKTLTICPL